MQLGDLRTLLSTVLNFNAGQTNQDFSTAQLTQALNLAYNRIVVDAQQHGSKRFFAKTVQFTWPASQVSYNLTDVINFTSLIALRDVTDAQGGVGTPLTVWWKEHNKLQWGTTGPASDRTIEVHYYASAETMVGDGESPSLVPPEFHEFIVWDAAIWLREMADEQAPQAFEKNRMTWEQRYLKHVMLGRPQEDTPRVGMVGGWLTQSTGDTGDIPTQDGTSLDHF